MTKKQSFSGRALTLGILGLIPGLLFAATPSPLQDPGAALPAAPVTHVAEEKVPLYSTSIGFTYLQTDLTNVSGGPASYVLGWYGIPQYHLSKHVSVIADFTNFWNFHAGGRENIHGFTGGPAYSLKALGKITPFVFAEGGAVRDSKQGAVNWAPAALGGLGFEYKLTQAVAFQVVPGEYVATLQPNGTWTSNYNAKAGFTFTSFKRKHPN